MSGPESGVTVQMEPSVIPTVSSNSNVNANAPAGAAARPAGAIQDEATEGVSESSSESTQGLIERPALVGTSWVKNIWYYALPSDHVKKGKTVSMNLLGDLILIGRKSDGSIFAMRDICPHQGAPLSFGRFDGNEVSCPFHGWKFDSDGVCTDIPALCSDQQVNICKIKTRSYPCQEADGNIWLYYGEPRAEMPDIPRAHGLDGLKYDQTVSRVIVPTHMDYAVVALIDPAHVPYVHKSWWWRNDSALKEKKKLYVPAGTGWTMVKHKPSKGSLLFKLIGDFLETEIAFRLPGCRTEYIQLFGRTAVASMTTVTPIDENNCELNHTSYWTFTGWKWLLKPIVNAMADEFLGQDLQIAQRQQIGLKFKPKLTMIVKDSGLPGSWYFQGKREWNNATEEGRKFINPVREKVLRWMT